MITNLLHKRVLFLVSGMLTLLFGKPHLESSLCSSTDFSCISLSHTEGKGLGYSQGYTSLELFLSHPCENQIVPFLDLRGHLFNEGKNAANVGAGIRWMDGCCNRLWGINFFYDTLRTSQLAYNQLGLGLECLGENWDFRINGYLPIGHKNTQIYRLSYDFSSGFLAKAREQFAMGGFDAEIGYRSCFCQGTEWYAGLGPYAYWGRSQKTTNAFRSTHKTLVGGRLRASAQFLSYFALEGVTTYDSRFKWGGQVTVSLNLPFDWFCSHNRRSDDCGEYCSATACRPVFRNEIILVNRINRFSSNPLILDPEFEP